jgi:predicted site-specific integrase-resolvase
MKITIDPDVYLAPGEAASMFHVDPRTITRWRKQGRLDSVHAFQTPGGTWRYNEADLLKLQAGGPPAGAAG